MTSDNFFNCQFCGKYAQYSPIEDMKKFNAKVYFCYTCSVEYIYWGNGGYTSISIYSTYNNKMYRWSFIASTGEAFLFYVKIPGIPGTRRNDGVELIKSFKSNIPTITPANFVDKLAVYLLFI